ncbi:MAG: chromosomal replication initiator DnaA [Planktomarina sp.]
MPKQLSFDLPVRVARGRASFFVSRANEMAVAMLDAPQAWPLRKMILQGPKASGKSHLLDIWQTENHGIALDLKDDFDLPDPGTSIMVDDIDLIAGDMDAETRLFHLHNHLAATDGTLLMATSRPVAQCGFSLPDLLSRLQGSQVTRIDAPDDEVLGAVLLKGFMDRQVAPPPNVQSYILKHMDRSFAAAQKIVAELDHISITEKRPITRAMAALVIQGQSQD